MKKNLEASDGQDLELTQRYSIIEKSGLNFCNSRSLVIVEISGKVYGNRNEGVNSGISGSAVLLNEKINGSNTVSIIREKYRFPDSDGKNQKMLVGESIDEL